MVRPYFILPLPFLRRSMVIYFSGSGCLISDESVIQQLCVNFMVLFLKWQWFETVQSLPCTEILYQSRFGGFLYLFKFSENFLACTFIFRAQVDITFLRRLSPDFGLFCSLHRLISKKSESSSWCGLILKTVSLLSPVAWKQLNKIFVHIKLQFMVISCFFCNDCQTQDTSYLGKEQLFLSFFSLSYIVL